VASSKAPLKTLPESADAFLLLAIIIRRRLRSTQELLTGLPEEIRQPAQHFPAWHHLRRVHANPLANGR
jgi:hypothetical protein